MEEIKKEADRLLELYLPHQTGTIDNEVIGNFKEDVRRGKSKLVAMMDFSKRYKATQCAIIDVSNTIGIFENNIIDIGQYNYWKQVKQELESRL